MTDTALVRITVEGGALDGELDIEYRWVGPPAPGRPVLVFLHEGLGSVAMWKEFPQALCQALGLRGLVYSRPGYGRSTPRPANEHWGLDFMHRQAESVLPALLKALAVPSPYALFGHSDGGSIALLHAAFLPSQVAAVVVMAPHILVEEFGLKSIRQAREQFEHGDLRQGLAKYHDDVESAFGGWAGAWLAPDFPLWQITLDLKHISAPVMAIQGQDDPYGTMAQIEGIAQCLPGTQLVKLPACGHSPHRDAPAQVIQACQAFFASHHLQETIA